MIDDVLIGEIQINIPHPQNFNYGTNMSWWAAVVAPFGETNTSNAYKTKLFDREPLKLIDCLYWEGKSTWKPNWFATPSEKDWLTCNFF